MKRTHLLLTSFAVTQVLPTAMAQQNIGKQPNIVWFLAEDLSTQYLALFSNNGQGVATPGIARLAREGILYSNVYCNSPVSSAARTTLITGCYAPRFEGSFHRNFQEFPLPEGLQMFPFYLRKKGYDTYNTPKTDYNVQFDNEAWSKVDARIIDWRNRDNKSRPFFLQVNDVRTHESSLHFKIEAIDETKLSTPLCDVFLHPAHPDTQLMRYTYATFYDRIKETDRAVESLFEMLEKEGVLDNTFVFFFGDNGGALPGTKGYVSEAGLHVPLVIYIPEKWRNEMRLPIGSVDNTIVSFMDFAPTVLNLAGIDIPKQMDGTPFLGRNPEVVGGRKAVCYGDRFDELYAFDRSLRKGRFLYVRNFQPYQSKSLFATYRYRQLAFSQWKELYEGGKLNDVQSAFFLPAGAEELYDLEKDPLAIHNLATVPEYLDTLRCMRSELNEYLLDKSDLGFFPETVVLEKASNNPEAFGKVHQKQLKTYRDIANLQLRDFSSSKRILKQSLASDDPVERWWALTTCVWFGQEAAELDEVVAELLDDERSFVRSKTMVFLAIIRAQLPSDVLNKTFRNSKTKAETLLVLNDIAYLKDRGFSLPSFDAKQVRHSSEEIEWRLNYLLKNN